MRGKKGPNFFASERPAHHSGRSSVGQVDVCALLSKALFSEQADMFGSNSNCSRTHARQVAKGDMDLEEGGKNPAASRISRNTEVFPVSSRHPHNHHLPVCILSASSALAFCATLSPPCMHTCTHTCIQTYTYVCMYVCMHAFMHACLLLCFEGEKKAQIVLPPPAGETPDPCHLSGPEMISYTFRHQTPGLAGGRRRHHGTSVSISFSVYMTVI